MLAFLLMAAFISACEKDDISTADPTENLTEISGYPIAGTNQTTFFSNTGTIAEPAPGDDFYGHNAHYPGYEPSYTDNGDGTVTDHITGLMWEKGIAKADFGEAQSLAVKATTAGYTDWRVPTVKELYSLIFFTGNQGTGNPESPIPPDDAVAFIDTENFEFEYPSEGRYIDAQYITSTVYVSSTMDGAPTFFGVNFADGRIKGYPQDGGAMQATEGRYYLRLVRGNTGYGVNSFVENSEGTISDRATGLMWMKFDSGHDDFSDMLTGFTNNDGSLNWQEALEFANAMDYDGYSDWRLPDAKELQSIADYTRSPETSGSAAIDPLFDCTVIANEAGADDFPFYWTSTSFEPGLDAVYIAFGRALGYFDPGSGTDFYDVHGAGAQRTDPKMGEPSYGNGPQGDVRRVYNYVRLVRNEN